MVEFAFLEIAQWLQSDRKVSGKILGFQHNSHQVRSGDLFFALKGERVDGHHFLSDVAKKGAVGAVISRDYHGEKFGLTCIEVEDVLGALQRLAKIVHSKRSTRVIGVTGSVGKTTTKEFIATLLEGKFRVAKTPGNANSQVGVPLSILNSSGEEEVFVMEMGMSQLHEIEQLVDIAPPEVALITKIAMAHAVFFPEGLEGIAAAKAEIFSHPKTRWGILNHHVTQFSAPQKVGTFQKLSYCLESEGVDCDVTLLRKKEGFCIREKEGDSPCFKLPFLASHLCENFLGAAVIARKMGMDWSEIIAQAQKLKVYKNRFELVEHEGILFLNDSYNANPTSMKAALLNLPSPREGGKKIAVLGAMKELGAFTEQSHLEVGQIALEQVDHLLCLGEECQPMVELFQREKRPAELFHDLPDVKKRVRELAKVGDVVLLKGSNSKQLWLVLEN